MTAWNRLPITDGMGQDSRLLPALKEGYVHVDEMSFAHLLAMSEELAGALHFYNLKNEREGRWSDLLSGDAVTIMAQIVSADLRGLDAEFSRRISVDGDAAARFVVGLANQIDTWVQKLAAAEDEAGKALSQRIAEVIATRLAMPMQEVGVLLERSEQRPENRAVQALAHLSSLWGIKQAKEPGARRSGPPTERPSPIVVARVVRTAFDAVVHAIAYIKELAPASLQDSLRTQTHSPAMGLLIAFLKLYTHAQGAINRFPMRHLQFYYDRVLNVVSREAVSGSLHLSCEMAGGTKEVLIRKGTEFTAGQDKAQQDRIYVADADILVTNAKVAALRTLFFARDPQISPESELHYVTGIQTQRVPLAATPDGDASMVPSPLFGARRTAAKQGSGEEAFIGFAVASQMLLLKEGCRKVTIDIDLTDSVMPDLAVRETLLEQLKEAPTEEAFSKLLGRIFSRYLLAGNTWLTPEDKQGIVEKSRTFANYELSEKLIDTLLKQDRHAWFYQYFKKLFVISLTGESGWHQVDHYALTLPDEHDHEAHYGLTCSFVLGPEVEPIVPYVPAIHGGRWETRAPLIRFGLNIGNDICPYSLFDGLALRAIGIEVTVEGAKDLLVYNNNGQLDPSKPFSPFGPIPTAQSYVIVGYHEAAMKDVVDLSVEIDWGELPREEDGFRTHYRGYDTRFSNESFTVDSTVLRDGRWQPQQRELRFRETLFDTGPAGGRLSENKTLKATVMSYFKPADPGISEEKFRFDQKTRDGFFKFTLISPDAAFGHGEYPSLLARVLSDNARLKGALVKPIPNPPYTPRINRMALRYTAKRVVTGSPNQVKADDPYGDKVFHLHPFGNDRVFPLQGTALPSLWPQYHYDGNLFIGLAASDLKGPLTLFFHLREDSSQEEVSGKSDIEWFYLASNRWRRLAQSRILSNTTAGFLSSGIVTVDVPEDIDRNNSVMPAEYFWLRVAANGRLHSFCSLYSVRTHVLPVRRRRNGSWQSGLEDAIPADAVWRPVSSISGLGKITRIGPIFGGRPAETPVQLITRTSERSRHKYRASLPWDYEQLILEHFPAVFKVKCFPHTTIGAASPSPGHVLIVVVPYLKGMGSATDFTPMMNAMELNQIRRFVEQVAAPFVEIDVRNPVYEWIQVRCTVKLSSGARHGVFLKKLNQAITDYLSPWKEQGMVSRFGWCVRREDVEAYIRSLDYVEFVTNFSMLHITEDAKDSFSLGDTAPARRDRAADPFPQWEGIDGVDEVRPKYPWSLPMPLKNHFIETTDALEHISPNITGIDELEIGSTFIIGPKERHG